MSAAKPKRDLLTLSDLGEEDFQNIFRLSAHLKQNPIQSTLRDKLLGMIFTKSSTRTRVSFEVGIAQLGGRALFLSPHEIQLGRGETIADTARVLSRYLDGIIIRTHAHEELQVFASHASIPVINGLTDLSHPCQVLTDLFTIIEKRGTLRHQKIVFLGDCRNNMAYSWTLGAARLGLHLVFSGHPDYRPETLNPDTLARDGHHSETRIEWVEDPARAASDANVLYTDVWTSMGQEQEATARREKLAPWQLSGALLQRAKPDALVMHCLPAHRGEEITDEVLDGPRSVVWDQAENRLHVQKAILTLLFQT